MTFPHPSADPRPRRPAAYVARAALLGAALALAISARSAAAQQTFTLTFNGGTGPDMVSVAAQLSASTTANANGFYTVLGITGTQNGQAITGLTDKYGRPDNVVRPTIGGVSGLTRGGLAFILADGTKADVYFDFGRYSLDFDRPDGSGGGLHGSVAITPAETTPAATTAPEPATWALLGTGLLTVGGLARRRRGG